MKKTIFGVFLLTFLIQGCLKDKVAEKISTNTNQNSSICDSLNTDFTTVIQPIFMNSCAVSGCHDAASNSAGYTFETYSQISANATIALHTMNYDPGYQPMPKPPFPSPLADTTIQKVQCWVDKGMPQ